MKKYTTPIFILTLGVLVIMLVYISGISRPINGVTFEGRIFYSAREYEIGLGPDGLAMGKWSVAFCSNDTFIWHYSDKGTVGTYTYNDETGSMVIKDHFLPHSLSGIYNRNEHTLIWNGVEYKEAIWESFWIDMCFSP